MIALVLLRGTRVKNSTEKAFNKQILSPATKHVATPSLLQSKGAGPRRPTPAQAATDIEASAAPAERDIFRQECWEQCGSPCVSGKKDLECPILCSDDSECEADELCTATASNSNHARPFRCLHNQCSGPDSHDECGEGMACNYLGRMEGGVFLCAKSGLRKNGEPCASDEYDEIGLCERGLLCVNSQCVKASCTDNADCGPGAQCSPIAGAETMSQCFPYCETDGDCAEEHVCATHKQEGTSRCVSPESLGCLLAGCAEGKECVVDDQFLTTITSCMKSCLSTEECEDNEACEVITEDAPAYCYQECGEDFSCEEGWRCAEEHVTPLCVRDLRFALKQSFSEYEK